MLRRTTVSAEFTQLSEEHVLVVMSCRKGIWSDDKAGGFLKRQLTFVTNSSRSKTN